MKIKLWVSISGGRTSAYMAIMLLLKYSHLYELIFIYANTGLEDEQTLIFLDKLDKEYNLKLVWLEAVINPARMVGTTHKIVDFHTAERTGRLFEEMIDVYGIPNQAYPHCTRELKLQVMESYVRSIGWGKEWRAIGIRIDEENRTDKKAIEHKKLYPLVDLFPTEKPDVLDFFKGHKFDLDLPEHRGNCVTCWKKSDKKILRLINDNPKDFEFFDRMEKEKGLCGHNVDGTKRVFFRNNRSTQDMLALNEAMPELDFNKLDRCANEECGLE